MAFLDETGLTYFWSKVKANINSTVSNHANNKSNPHGVTKSQVGLGNVDNVSRASILQSVYPVGAIYMSTVSTSPASLFGGTWEQIQGRFLLGASSGHAAGSTGGEETHKLTTAEMPSHSHTFTGTRVTTDTNSAGHTHSIPQLSGSTNAAGAHQHNIPAVQAGETGGSLTILGGDDNAVTRTAGNHSHTVTTNASTTGWQTANHTHNVTAEGSNSNTGGNGAHNNMPPYLSVYMWKRTA